MDWITMTLFAVGLAFLTLGAELLVKGASRLAAAVGVSPLVVGLTVVSFGTSAPEMAVSAKAAWNGQSEIAVGNVVGSNIFNVLFILGISALITPLVVNVQLVRIDIPIMIGVSVLLWLLSLDGGIGIWDSLVFLLGIIGYTVLTIRMGKTQAAPESDAARGANAAPLGGGVAHALRQSAMILVGLALLVIGARWLVNGAVQMATAMGVSQAVIGLTIIAAGTSLPEVAASTMAAFRGERDIAVGNVVGSNIFNILGILGVSGVVAGGDMRVAAGIESFELPVMTAAALACLPIVFTGHRINRWEGALFLAYYVAYVVYLFFAASKHDALPSFSKVMLFFAAPLTLITLGVILYRDIRSRRADASR